MENTIKSLPVWDALKDRWRTTIRSKALSSNTERTYMTTARFWSQWLASKDYDIEPEDVRGYHVEEFVADIISKTSAANAAHHYRNMSVYCTWMVDRGHITGRNPMDKLEPPVVPEKLTPILDDAEFDGIVATCPNKTLIDLRDKAILLLFRDTGARVSELGLADLNDLDMPKRRCKVRGKGSKERWVGYGPDAALALARYLRARAGHIGADIPALWLTRTGKRLAVNTIKHMLNRRGKRAGLHGNLHAHRFRHGYAHTWKSAGGSDEGLMSTGGWSTAKMARHYGRIARDERALEEQQRLFGN